MENTLSTTQLKMGYTTRKAKAYILYRMFFAFKKGGNRPGPWVNTC